MTNEQDLFFALTNFINPDKERIRSLLPENASASLLGNLFFNRMQGIAYGTLKSLDLLGTVNREFRNSLGSAYEQNSQKNLSYFKCVEYITTIFNDVKKPYALLKGALLCKMYPTGYRTSNDIDVLVNALDVGVFSQALLKAGFKQGNIRNGTFVAATRQEIVSSKLMRGETVPFIIEINLPQIKYLEVDINFSLDYKPGDSKMIEKLLNDSVIENTYESNIRTLNKSDFFIHLCCHLYKEATTLPWIKMKRDMTLYKYIDILYFVNGLSLEDTTQLFIRAEELKLKKICACVTLWVDSLWPIDNDVLIEWANKVIATDPDFLLKVIAPTENKDYIYANKDIKERFFTNDRTKILKEITYEKT